MFAKRRGLDLFPLLLAGLLGACALPQRDNIHDPSKAPVAILEVRVLVAGTAFVGNQGSRTTTFVLDASQSVDPFHHSNLNFDWDLDGDGIFEVPRAETQPCPGTAVLACLLRSFDIPASQLPASGVGSAARMVSVNVATDAGYHAKASANIAVSNAAPIVDPGDELAAIIERRPTIVLDACGGTPIGCPTYDPDGDVPLYTWAQTRGETVQIVPSGLRATFQAPAAPQLLSFRLTADDRLARTTATVNVRIGQPTWLSAFDPSRLYRVFPEFVSRPIDGAILGTPAVGEFQIVTALAVEAATGESFIATERINGLIQNLERRVLRLSHDLRVLGSVNVAPVGVIEELAARGTWACLLFDDNTTVSFARMNVAGGGVFSLVGSPDATFVRRVIADPSNATDCLVATDLGAYRIGAAAGAFTPIAQTFNLPVPNPNPPQDVPPLAWAASADGSVWVTNGATLVRFLGGVRTEMALSPPITDVRAILPRAGGGLWAAAGTSTRLYRIDAATGVTAMSFGVGPFGPNTFGFPFFGPRHVDTDPIDGSIWIANNLLTRLERLVEKDGDLVLAGAVRPEDNAAGLAEGWDEVAVDVRGGRAAAVSALSPTVFSQDSLMMVPSHMRRILDIDQGGGQLSLDQTRGAVWSSYNRDVFRISSSGRVLTRIFVTNTSLGFAGVDADSEGGAWIGDGDLIHVDGSGNELQRIPMPCTASVIDGGNKPELCAGCVRTSLANPSRMFRIVPATGTVTELTSPGTFYVVTNAVRTEDGACWFVDNSQQAIPPDLIRVPAGGSIGVTLATIRGSGLAPDPRENSTVWILNAAGPRMQRWSSLGGLMTDLPGQAGAFGIHARCLDSTNPQCIELWNGSGATGTQFFRMDSVTGGVIETFDLPAGTPGTLEIP